MLCVLAALLRVTPSPSRDLGGWNHKPQNKLKSTFATASCTEGFLNPVRALPTVPRCRASAPAQQTYRTVQVTSVKGDLWWPKYVKRVAWERAILCCLWSLWRTVSRSALCCQANIFLFVINSHATLTRSFLASLVLSELLAPNNTAHKTEELSFRSLPFELYIFQKLNVLKVVLPSTYAWDLRSLLGNKSLQGSAESTLGRDFLQHLTAREQRRSFPSK